MEKDKDMEKNRMEEKPTGLTEEKLDDVAGGGWSDSNLLYASGDTPRYRVGQVVCGYYIKAINEKKGGLINKEFTYVVAYNYDRNIIKGDNVYESELMVWEKFRG